MKITRLSNGNLAMSVADDMPRFQQDFAPVNLKTSRIESVFITRYLVPLGFKEIKPEECGALTDAPLITDGQDVWGYMSYQVSAFLEHLAAGRTVIWQKG